MDHSFFCLSSLKNQLTERKQERSNTPTSQQNTWTSVPNVIEIYMQFSVRSVSRETIAGVLVFQSCTIMLLADFKANFVSFWLLWYFGGGGGGILPICVMFASILISNTTTELAIFKKINFLFIKVLFCHNFLINLISDLGHFSFKMIISSIGF